MSDNVTIRKAVKNDMKSVFNLIKELAIFQKLEDQVKITVDILENDGFSNASSPAFYCFVAECNDKIIGYVIYYYCYSTWLGKSIFCEDLYVKSEFRTQGIGRKLMMEVIKVAEKTSGRLDFHVLSWNPAVKFYENLGATNLTAEENWSLYRINTKQLCKLIVEENNL